MKTITTNEQDILVTRIKKYCVMRGISYQELSLSLKEDKGYINKLLTFEQLCSPSMELLIQMEMCNQYSLKEIDAFVLKEESAGSTKKDVALLNDIYSLLLTNNSKVCEINEKLSKNKANGLGLAFTNQQLDEFEAVADILDIPTRELILRAVSNYYGHVRNFMIENPESWFLPKYTSVASYEEIKRKIVK